jgi:hypothetical protein
MFEMDHDPAAEYTVPDHTTDPFRDMLSVTVVSHGKPVPLTVMEVLRLVREDGDTDITALVLTTVKDMATSLEDVLEAPSTA